MTQLTMMKTKLMMIGRLWRKRIANFVMRRKEQDGIQVNTLKEVTSYGLFRPDDAVIISF